MILLELFQETPTKYERVAIHLFNDDDVEFEEACRMLAAVLIAHLFPGEMPAGHR